MDTMVTQVETVREAPIEDPFVVAALDRAMRAAKRAERFAAFGTIGFDAYKAWILAQGKLS